MKFGQFISVILIAAIVGIASNFAYSYLSTEKKNADEIKFEEFLDERRIVGVRMLNYFDLEDRANLLREPIELGI